MRRSRARVSRGKLSGGRQFAAQGPEQGRYEGPGQPTRLPSCGSGSGGGPVQAERVCSGSEERKEV